jgi:nucleoid DNA-binding protein
MKKDTLIKKMAEKFNLPAYDVKNNPQRTAKEYVDFFVESMIKTLKNGESITFRGLGTFSVKISPAKVGQNIGKGEAVHIPPQPRIYFKASKYLRGKVKSF